MSSSTTFELSDKCLETIRHEGTPAGTIETIEGGHRVYIAKPKQKQHDDAALLVLPDVFGMDHSNSKLIADGFAENGLLTYMPDIFNGDPVPPDYPNSPNFSIDEWRPNHGPQQTRPALDATLQLLKKQGVGKIFAVGYCFGARYVFDVAFEGTLRAAAVAHPSLLKVPEDFERLASLEPKVPFLFNTCERDRQFPVESQAKADEILGPLGDKLYKRNYYPDIDHGFAIRGDLSKSHIKAAKEAAFNQTVEWFKQHL